jgi:pyridinium-3,5-bisthiocarboxylic acid mononucleotide nickel chelatase
VTIAILDPFSGIAGDMTLGALLDVGLDADWLRALPGRLGLHEVEVRIQRVRRSELACTKVDFDIPPQPHGRGIAEIREIVARAGLPEVVQQRADAVYWEIALAEGAMHGVDPERVHFHEVGAVDAILDVVGVVWGFEQLAVERIHCGPIALGDGSVRAAHGELPVPAPATIRLLEGHEVRPGPAGSGELVTPTGAALVRVLSSGPPPSRFVPRRSGYGAGTRDPAGRPNALRIVLADAAAEGAATELLVMLATDVDDMNPEHMAFAAEQLRGAGALDVTMAGVLMKKGRAGTRIEVLSTLAQADDLERLLFSATTTLGVRRIMVERTALAREMHEVDVLDHRVRVKVARLPGGGWRAKPEFEDVAKIAGATGLEIRDVFGQAALAAERVLGHGVFLTAGKAPRNGGESIEEDR